MANKVFCDKCNKKVYDYYEINLVYDNKELHLCDDCKHLFYDWINNKIKPRKITRSMLFSLFILGLFVGSIVVAIIISLLEGVGC